jgi:hypothetical protein
MFWSSAKLPALALVLFCLSGTEPSLAVELGAASLSPEAAQADRQAHEQSRRIFEFGVQLFQEGNLVGALTQFEAAYQVHPNSAALQNIALSQKGLYRYGEAKRSLELLLSRHSDELSAQDKKTALNVIAELSAFIGKVQITVLPESSTVAIDEREFQVNALPNPLELDVGEHRLTVAAPGHAPMQKTLSIAGGVTNPPILISLAPTHGYLTVITPDDRTAIAIDGRAMAFQEYRAFIEPGRHVIQIYRSGFEPYEAVVELDRGQSVTVRGKVGAPLSESDSAELEELRHEELPPRQLRGWYGLLDGSLSDWVGAPQDILPTRNNNWGMSYGLRAGYRFFTPIGIEAVAGITHHEATGSCVDSASACHALVQARGDPLNFDYSFDSRRVGGALRIMSGGEGVRFTSTVGVGAVSHDLHWPGPTLKGFDAYFALEAGAQINLDHFLVEMVGYGWFDSASSIKAGGYTPYQQGNGIQMFGLSLRVGWSEWTPRDARLINKSKL